MQVHRGASHWPKGLGPVVTIGNFDGVHLGHRALVARAIAEADALGVASCVYTFDPAPVQVLRPDRAAPRVQSLDAKLALLEDCGVEHVVVERFTRDFAALEPRAFAEDVLVGQLRARALVLGWDFRFGRGRGGTVEGMRAWLDIPVHRVEAVLHDGEPISSSRIRGAVTAGAVADATAMLGRPHQLVGTVVHGDARGRTLGFPTANLRLDTELLPPDGVWAVRVALDGKPVQGVANLGRRPTFGEGARGLEVHLLDWDGDLYGQRLSVSLIARVRDERRFDGPDALVDQIRRDVATARDLLA